MKKTVKTLSVTKKWFLLAALIFPMVLGGCGSSAKESSSEVASTYSSETEDIPTLELTPTPTDTPTPTASPTPTETPTPDPTDTPTPTPTPVPFDLATVPAYSGSPYTVINNNVPYFTDDELSATSFENYSSLDSLGRCGVCTASVGQDIMPTEERGNIGSVKPTGWHTVKYNGIVDGNYLYNRCHLIGYQLTGENANTRNLITGTRYLNVEGMLPFENMVADYVKETNYHVMYRVTPVFDGNNLLASGVLMEAKSVEDSGSGVLFCVYCYNVQPQVNIDYATGESSLVDGAVAASDATSTVETQTNAAPSTGKTYILNNNTHKFHLPGCSSVKDIKDSNKEEYSGSRDDLIARGYDPCKRCNP